MAEVKTTREVVMNRAAIAAVFVALIVMLTPIYWIASTAFKPRSLATTAPPTVFFEPTLTPFAKLFVRRSQMREPVDQETYDAAPWWEQLIYDDGESVVRNRRSGEITPSGYWDRYKNSLIISIISTFLAVSMGTLTAYGFSRFKVKGENDWLFFILSTRMLPPVVVAIPMFLMYRAVGLHDTHLGLIILYTAFNLSFSVWIMKGFMTNRNAQTAPPYIPSQVGSGLPDWSVIAAGAFLFLLPVAIFTFLLRNHLLRGMSFGAIRK